MVTRNWIYLKKNYEQLVVVDYEISLKFNNAVQMGISDGTIGS